MLVLRRNPDESWRQAALRAASRYGLEEEVSEDYAARLKSGESEEDAAWGACYEWDLLEYDPEQKNEPPTS